MLNKNKDPFPWRTTLTIGTLTSPGFLFGISFGFWIRCSQAQDRIRGVRCGWGKDT